MRISVGVESRRECEAARRTELSSSGAESEERGRIRLSQVGGWVGGGGWV